MGETQYSQLPKEIESIQNRIMVSGMPKMQRAVDWQSIINDLDSAQQNSAQQNVAPDFQRAYMALQRIRSYNFERQDYLDAYLLDVARFGLGEIDFDPNPVEYGLSANGE